MSNDDIVTRLLNEAQTSIYYEVKNENLLFDAVREIERLRTQIKELEAEKNRLERLTYG